MKTIVIIAAKTAAFFILLAASLVSFLIAYVTIDTDPWIWLVSCFGSIICFMLALGISLGVFGSDKDAPKAQTRSEYNHQSNLKTA